MTFSLKVLTLNCWGVFTPLACDFRHERIRFIGEELSKRDYDIAILEELWSEYDYYKIAGAVKDVLPHSHLFFSGLIGTGVAIFSKYQIQETFLHKFSLNGYAHKIHHGDWFGGKGVGLATFMINGLKVNVYGTHLHAQYDEATDEYPAHRTAQAFEISQFIKFTSSNADVAIIGGDFNLQPKDLGYRVILANSKLKDAWESQEAIKMDQSGSTCDRPDNIFHCKHTHTYAPEGLRLDYLLYQSSDSYSMRCKECKLTFQKIEGQEFPYSDHEGVEATFLIEPADECQDESIMDDNFEVTFLEAQQVMDAGLNRVSAHRIYAIVAALLGLVILSYSSDLDIPYGINYIIGLCRFIITLMIGYLLSFAIVMCTSERNGIEATKNDINNLLKSR